MIHDDELPVDQLHERSVETGVGGEFGMEAGGQQVALTHEHRIAIVRRQDFDVGTDRFDAWGADEHAVERSLIAGEVEVGFEAVDLAAVAIASHGDLERPEVLLVVAAVEDLVGEQDHPGARAEHGHPVVETGGDRVEKSRRAQQVGHRRRFPAGHHEGVDPLELPRGADLDSVHAERTQALNVGGECSLQGEYADVHLGAPKNRGSCCYQPRSANRWESGTSSIPIPVIGAPSPRLTLARIAASA